MKANPGGPIAEFEVVGRDKLIRQLWKTLETGSIRLEGEQRIGKTSILHKMVVEPPLDFLPVFVNLEPVRTADAFAEKLCKAAGRENFASDFGERSWKFSIQQVVEAYIDQARSHERRVVFFFDEMVHMLATLANQRPFEAMEVLDALRSFRQSWDGGRQFRMVLAGSFGMHHVLRVLGESGYSNAPLNDLIPCEVSPLTREYSIELARQLMEGEDLKASKFDESAETIADNSDGFPFIIHWIVHELVRTDSPATPDQIDSIVKNSLLWPIDPFSLGEYRRRLDLFYKNDLKTVHAILNYLAKSEEPQDFYYLKRAAAGDVEKVRELVRSLVLDRYLNRVGDKYQFQRPLLRRWWKLHCYAEPVKLS